jgi:hypothetical protein
MKAAALPMVKVDAQGPIALGENIYSALSGSLEYRRLDLKLEEVCSLGLGRLILNLSRESGELLGLSAYVKTGRWKTEGVGRPPRPDVQGKLYIQHHLGEEDFAFQPLEPAFMFDDKTRSLLIELRGASALVIQAANCLLVGLDREERLSDIWLLDLVFLTG